MFTPSHSLLYSKWKCNCKYHVCSALYQKHVEIVLILGNLCSSIDLFKCIKPLRDETMEFNFAKKEEFSQLPANESRREKFTVWKSFSNWTSTIKVECEMCLRNWLEKLLKLSWTTSWHGASECFKQYLCNGENSLRLIHSFFWRRCFLPDLPRVYSRGSRLGKCRKPQGYNVHILQEIKRARAGISRIEKPNVQYCMILLTSISNLVR